MQVLERRRFGFLWLAITSLLLGLIFVVQSNTMAAEAATTFDVNVTDHQPLSGIMGSGTSYVATQVAWLAGGAQYLCSGLDDSKCASNAEVFAMLPVCQSASEINCIEALEVKSEGTSGGAATHQKTIGKLAFPAQPDIGLPAGSNISLWSVPSLKSAGKVGDFAVTVRVKLLKSGNNLRAEEFSARVEPYTLGTTTQDPVSTVERTNPTGVVGISGIGGDRNCIWIESGQCGQVTDFPKDSRVKLTIRIGNYLTSWLHGRFTDPNIKITAIDAKNNRLEMDAAPVKVPSATALVNADEASDEVKSKFKDPSGFLPPGNISMYTEATQRGAMQNFLDFEKFFSKKSNKLVDTWSMRSLSGQANSCSLRVSSLLKEPLSTLIGVVATNAVTYESQPPAFTDGELKYQVAGLRYLADGTTVFQGRYDLLMRSEFARCLYGYTDAPVIAEVSITNEEGTNVVATTNLKESGGWLMLGAYGFTFSAPTLRVKLNQEKKAAPTPTPTPSPTITATATPSPASASTPIATPTATSIATPSAKGTTSSSKVSITCVKGKIVKKVSGTSPKCPKGFKKK